jgi:hypothetical protein
MTQLTNNCKSHNHAKVIHTFRMSRRHSLADNTSIDCDAITPISISDEKLNTSNVVTNPLAATKMNRRYSSSADCTYSSNNNDNGMNHILVRRITPPSVASAERNEIIESTTGINSSISIKTTKKIRYPSSPFRRRKATLCSHAPPTSSTPSNGPLTLSENVVPSQRQRHFVSPIRRRNDKTIGNDELPIKPERSTSEQKIVGITSECITDTTTKSNDEDRATSPIKRRRTPSRSPSASVRTGFTTMRDCLKPTTIESESRNQNRHAVLQHRNSMLPRKDESIDGEIYVWFGTTDVDSHDLNISYCEPETAATDDERHCSYYSVSTLFFCDLKLLYSGLSLKLMHFIFESYITERGSGKV